MTNPLGDSLRAVDNPFTCQGALFNRRAQQRDSPRVIATDHDNRLSTAVQNYDLLLTCEYLSKTYEPNYKRTYEHLLRTYEHLLRVRTYEKLVLATCD